MQAIRKGNYPVVATNHTLILNWNSQTVPLLRQIAINKKEQAGAAYAGYALLTHTVTVAHLQCDHCIPTHQAFECSQLHVSFPGFLMIKKVVC